MAITSLDGAITGMRPAFSFFKTTPGTPVIGNTYSLWRGTGAPGLGAFPANISGTFYTSLAAQVVGQIPFTNPSGGQSSYLSVLNGSSSQVGTLIIADRIWGDSVSPTTIGNQNVWSGAFPRSTGTATGDSSGNGILLALECLTTLGATSATPKITYIGSDGLGDTQPLFMAMPSSAAIGTFIPFNLGAGKAGVRSVSQYNNMTTLTSGGLGLVAYRKLAQINCIAARVGDAVDALTSGFPTMFNNTVPFLIWVAGSVTAPLISGSFIYTQG